MSQDETDNEKYPKERHRFLGLVPRHVDLGVLFEFFGHEIDGFLEIFYVFRFKAHGDVGGGV
jgi:hypothetical protein